MTAVKIARTLLMPIGLAVLALTVNDAQKCRAADQEAVILDFSKPFLFTYKNWKDKIEVADSTAHIKAADGKGGGGYNFNNPTLNLEKDLENSPVLLVKVNVDNQAKAIRLLLLDNNGIKATFVYSLENVGTQEFITLFPQNNATLKTPNEVSAKEFDTSSIKQVQVLGDWMEGAVDIVLKKVMLMPVER